MVFDLRLHTSRNHDRALLIDGLGQNKEINAKMDDIERLRGNGPHGMASVLGHAMGPHFQVISLLLAHFGLLDPSQNF
jgi:hypothetical protein